MCNFLFLSNIVHQHSVKGKQDSDFVYFMMVLDLYEI